MKSIRRLIYIITRLWTLPVQRAIENALFKNAPCRQIDSFSICVDGVDQVVGRCVENVKLALCLLARFDERRLMLARRHFSKFIVSGTQSVNAGHFPRSRTCHLSAKFVLEYSVANLAIVIVHETTHARIDRAGIPYYPDLSNRIERRCALEEIAFAERLPVGTYSSLDLWLDDRRKDVREMSISLGHRAT